MEEKEVKKEKALYKKWWFWLIIFGIVVLICFTVILLRAFNIVLDEVGILGGEIKSIYSDATVYSSADSNTLIIELRNWSNDNTEEMNQIVNVVKDKINNGELSSYNKLITLAYLESSGKNEVLFIRNSYKLPDFTQSEETKEYIDFQEYQNLYDTLDETMDSYTGLFNSIY